MKELIIEQMEESMALKQASTSDIQVSMKDSDVTFELSVSFDNGIGVVQITGEESPFPVKQETFGTYIPMSTGNLNNT
jgi:hypothetical protein